MRWFGLACFIVLVILAWRKHSLKHYGLAILLGAIVGFLLDCGGVTSGLWNYPRQPFMSLNYWLIVVPCWGVFGATINMVNDWYMRSNWKSYVILTLLIMGLYEIPNLATVSWHYTVSALMITVGWFPLVLAFRLSYLLTVSQETRNKFRGILDVIIKDRVTNTR